MELDYSFAPQPHALIAEMEISHGAVRLWGFVHALKWNRLDPEPEALADAFRVDRRTIFRWLAELEKHGWVTWARYHSNPAKRLLLRTGAEGDAAAAAAIAQIRALFAAGSPTLDQIRSVIDNPDNDPAGGGDLGGKSDMTITSDSTITSDMYVTSDSTITSDIHVTNGDRHVTESDIHVTNGDRHVTESDPDVTCDRTITSPSNSALAAAVNQGARDHGGGGGRSSLLKRLQHHHHASAKRAKNVTPGTAYEPTDSERWMVADGAGTTRAAQWRDLPLAVVQAERARRAQLGQGWGAIFDAWAVAPPQIAAPVPAAAPADDLAARAAQLAPDGATTDEIALLMLELGQGASAEQAQAALAAARAVAPDGEAREARRVWNQAIGMVQQALGGPEFNTWLRPIQLAQLDDTAATLLAPNAVVAAHVERTYLRLIGDALGQVVGRRVQVQIRVA